MYSGEYDACDVTLSVYPHRASLKNMLGHGGNRTYDLWNYCLHGVDIHSCMSKGHACYTVQFFIFSCDLQCNSTLERCKITKYESSLHSADVFSTY